MRASVIEQNSGDFGGDTAGDTIWISKKGSDSLPNNGSFAYPYLTVTKALSEVTSTRKTVIAMPGVYEEAGGMTWPTVSGVKLIGFSTLWQTEIEVATDDTGQVLEIAPGAQSSTFEFWISNLRINHDTTGLDGIKLTHTSVGKKMLAYLDNVGGDADSDSDKFLTVTHGGSGNAVRIYASGRNGDVDGAVYFQSKDGGDKLYINDMYLMGGIEFSTDATALILRLKDCVVKHEGITGGSTSTVVYTMSCFSETGGTFAALDTDDVAGNITGETVIV